MQTLNFTVLPLIIMCSVLFWVDRKVRKRKRKLSFTLFFHSLTIKATNMSTQIHKSKFPVSGKIGPTGDGGEAEPVNGVTFSSSNEAAVTVAQDTTDETKFTLNYVGNGDATITANAKDADGNALSESLDVTASEDDATKLNISLAL